MIYDVFKFKSNRVNLVSSGRFFDCRLRNLLAVFFPLSRDVVLAFSGISFHLVNKGARFLRIQ